MNRRHLAALAGATLVAGSLTVAADTGTAHADLWGCNARQAGPDAAYGYCYYDDNATNDYGRVEILCSNASGSSRAWVRGTRVYDAGPTSWATCPSFQPIGKAAVFTEGRL